MRCVPPENKPTTAEIATCRSFLQDEFSTLPNVRAMILLGRIAHDSTLRTLGIKAAAAPFGHGAEHDAGKVRLFDSYHCSRYNTNTGRLTEEMFRAVFERAKAYLTA